MPATSLKELAASAAAREARRPGLYDADPWSWSQQQADALRRRDYGAVDWDNVIEEIEDVGRRDEKEWASPCKNVVSHLLKIQHDPDSSSLRHWRDEILDWREQMHAALEDSPGVKGKLPGLLGKAWARGRRLAANKLVESAGAADGAAEKRVRRSLELRLPRERAFHVEDIAGCDPYARPAAPDPYVWPAPVARVLNAKLGTDYPVLERAPEQERGRAPGFSR